MADRVSLRALQAAHGEAFIAAARRSRALHRPWFSAPCTADAFVQHLARFQTPTSYAYVAWIDGTCPLAGGHCQTNIVSQRLP